MSASAETAERGSTSRKRRAGCFFPLLLLFFCGGLAILLHLRGWEFYGLDLDARVDHDDYRVLSPGTDLGHGYGIFGTLLILTNLLYLPRRRFPTLRVGSMVAWLNMHVATGLVGSVLILYHSAFQLRSPIAVVTAASLFLVVLTGIVGRYLFAIAPKPHPEVITARLAEIDAFQPGLGAAIADALKRAPIPAPGNPSLFGAIAMLPTFAKAERQRGELVLDTYREATRPRPMTKAESRRIKGLVKQARRLAQKDVRSVAGAMLLRTWRSLHRYLAILMILSVTVHIAVAWYLGYRWIWSE